ncbi:MAG: hypothetical protein IPI30_14850 [Saprospiraceae bacterium]|nr:hypothetical protein [Candidatus Vicinibacter affinis]
MKKISILLVVLFFQQASFAQDRHLIDSIFTGLNVKENDTNKVKTINLLAYDYLGKDPNTSIYFSKEALKLSKKLNYGMGMTEAFFTNEFR